MLAAVLGGRPAYLSLACGVVEKFETNVDKMSVILS